MVIFLNNSRLNILEYINHRSISESTTLLLDGSFNIKSNISIVYFFNMLYGVSLHFLYKISLKFGIPRNCPISLISTRRLEEILKFLSDNMLKKSDSYLIDGLFLAKFQSDENYRGFRHLRGLPVRGQRTSSNAMSCRSILFHKKILNLAKYFNLNSK